VITLLVIAGLSGALGCPDSGRMVRIDRGTFWMGSDAAERALALALSSPPVREAGWIQAELPRRQITLPGFCIDRTLVTQEQYAAFVAQTGHRAPAISHEAYLRQGFLVHDYERAVRPYAWAGQVPPPPLRDHPVVLVSAHDAEAYCRWRHPAGRLPSEAEWERASRGDRGEPFPWGDRWDPDRLNSAARGPGGTTPVDRHPSGVSPHGLWDAVGNVFQWTATALGDGRRIVKGCAWDDEPGLCRPAFRHGRPPASRHILIGFRCAGSPSPEP
jgi:formylglycine-generating enzyme required for sulfatase activity